MALDRVKSISGSREGSRVKGKLSVGLQEMKSQESESEESESQDNDSRTANDKRQSYPDTLIAETRFSFVY